MNNKIKDRIKLDLLIKEYTEPEPTDAGTNLKIKLINKLIDNNIESINIFYYYYEVLKLNNNNE